MKDDRLYMRFPIEFPDDPKIAPLSAEAKWAIVEMVGYSRRQDLDGVIPRKYAEHRWGGVLDELLTADPVSPFLTFDEVYGYTLTKYAKHQFTSSDLAELKERKSRAGKSGAAKRWHGDDSAIAPAMADASQSDGRAHGKTWPESESESESESELDTNYLSEESLDPNAREFTPETIEGIRAELTSVLEWVPDELTTATALTMLIESSPRPIVNVVGYVRRCVERSPVKVRKILTEAARQAGKVAAELEAVAS